MTYTKIGTMKTNWEDQIGGYLSEAGEELLIELIGKRLPDNVTWCDNDELLAPVDFAGELNVGEIVSDAIAEFLRAADTRHCSDEPYYN